MKKYFYSDGSSNHGPFTVEELKKQHLNKDTMVWFQELGEWKPLAEVPELHTVLVITPPPVPQQNFSKKNTALTISVIEKAKYPKEDNRFVLAMFIGIPIALLGLIATIASFGILLLYLLIIIFIAWFSLTIAKMSLIGNSVRVSESNFPEIFEIYQDVKKEISFNKDVQIYIVEDGSVNAFLSKFFKTQFIVLNSELVKDMVTEKENLIQMKWIIARFIGALKAKHFRTTILKLIFENIEKIKIFNFFLLPYERATQYTGDNIGMLITKDVKQSILALNKLMIGNDLSDRIEFRGLLNQGIVLDNDSFFSFLARAFSTHPHLVNRYLNLLAFADKHFPEQFNNYLDGFDNKTKHTLFRILPRY